MPKPNPHKSIWDGLIETLSSSRFQGLATLAGLIAAIASDNLVIRIPALLILFGSLFALRSTIWHFLKRIATWLTWKFLLGITVGVLVGAILFPFFESIYRFGFSLFIPQVEVLETNPKDSETLLNLYDSIEINFSERIPSQYRSFINIEITPYIPIKRVWVYDFDPSDCCRTLFIESARYFPNSRNTQFEPNTTYHLRISGLLIKKPLEIEFHTASK